MNRTVTIAKGSTTWELPADHPLLPHIRDVAQLWGITIGAADATPSAPITKEYRTMSGSKEIIKRALEHGDIDRDALMAAVTKRATKAYPDAPTEAIAFAKLLADAPGLRQIIDAAPVAAPAAPRGSYEAIARGALAHARKSGTSLPPNSPYLPYLKATEAVGSRDDENTQIGPQMDKTVRAVAESLVAAGKFDNIETAHRYMKTSSRYAHLFKVPGLYAEGRRDMLAARR